jgi:ADP-ribose pyrophosphatase YjhB (NUDIX family)
MTERITRRSARAVLLDGPDLLLIKRTRPGEEPYWVTIGGGVEPEDATLEDALRREVLEEIGAQVRHVSQIHILVDRFDEGIAVQHVFLAELDPAELVERTGKEFTIPSRGDYELVRVPFTSEGISGIDLKPTALSAYLCATHDALRASLHFPVMNPVPAVVEGGGEDVADRVREPERA